MVSLKNKKSDSYIVGEPELNPAFAKSHLHQFIGTLSTVSFSFFLVDEGSYPWSAQQHCVKTACSSKVTQMNMTHDLSLHYVALPLSVVCVCFGNVHERMGDSSTADQIYLRVQTK